MFYHIFCLSPLSFRYNYQMSLESMKMFFLYYLFVVVVVEIFLMPLIVEYIKGQHLEAFVNFDGLPSFFILIMINSCFEDSNRYRVSFFISSKAFKLFLLMISVFFSVSIKLPIDIIEGCWFSSYNFIIIRNTLDTGNCLWGNYLDWLEFDLPVGKLFSSSLGRTNSR